MKKQSNPRPANAVKPPPPPAPPRPVKELIEKYAPQDQETLEPIELPEGRDPRETAVYESDFRKSNPALHRLYVEWAVNDLMVINQSLARLYAVSRICMLGAAAALQQERDKLVATSAAWADADVLVRSVYKHLRKPYIG